MDTGNQIFIFLICMSVGIVSGLVYEVFYLFRKLCKDKFGAVIVFDILFFLVFSLLFLLFAVIFSFPDFRMYMFLGNLLGLVLYLKSIHRIVDFFWRMCYNKLEKGIIARKTKKKNKKKEEIPT